MEKLRSEKLRDCGIMIQKHVKGISSWLFNFKFKKMTNSIDNISQN